MLELRRHARIHRQAHRIRRRRAEGAAAQRRAAHRFRAREDLLAPRRSPRSGADRRRCASPYKNAVSMPRPPAASGGFFEMPFSTIGMRTPGNFHVACHQVDAERQRRAVPVERAREEAHEERAAEGAAKRVIAGDARRRPEHTARAQIDRRASSSWVLVSRLGAPRAAPVEPPTLTRRQNCGSARSQTAVWTLIPLVLASEPGCSEPVACLAGRTTLACDDWCWSLRSAGEAVSNCAHLLERDVVRGLAAAVSRVLRARRPRCALLLEAVELVDDEAVAAEARGEAVHADKKKAQIVGSRHAFGYPAQQVRFALLRLLAPPLSSPASLPR